MRRGRNANAREFRVKSKRVFRVKGEVRELRVKSKRVFRVKGKSREFG